MITPHLYWTLLSVWGIFNTCHMSAMGSISVFRWWSNG